MTDLMCEDFSDDEELSSVAYQAPLRRSVHQGASADNLYGKKMLLPGGVEDTDEILMTFSDEPRPPFSIDQLLLMPMMAAKWLRNEDLSDVLKPSLRAIPAERLASFTPEQVRPMHRTPSFTRGPRGLTQPVRGSRLTPLLHVAPYWLCTARWACVTVNR
jgi:hypothetical protein